MTFFISTAVIAITLHPFWHERLINQNIEIDHIYHSMIAMCVIILMSIVGMLIGAEVEEVVSVLVSVPAFRWLAHDAILNIRRGKGINYLGQGENAAFSDRFLQKVWDQYGVSPVVFKVLAFLSCLSITISIIIYQNNL